MGPGDPDRGSQTPFEPWEPVVRRLTPDELARTVFDVFSLELTAEERERLPVDRPLEGFVRISTGQTTLPDHVLAYSELADSIVSRIDLEQAADGCVEGCAEHLAREWGSRLFRRPTRAEEVQAFGSVFQSASDEGFDVPEATGWMLRAMLQAPQFLYLLEAETEGPSGGLRTIGGYEMASRLSYALWGAPPDDGLRAAAEDGRLDRAEGVAAQARRLLQDRERVRAVLGRFVVDWARIESIPDDDGLRSDLIASARAYYGAWAERDVTLFELITDPRVALTPELAGPYGLPGAVTSGVELVQVPVQSGRGGLLAQPGVLAGMTNADGGAIVARGLFLQNQIFCSDTPDPPASLQEEIETFAAAQPEDASERQIAEIRMERNECGACHAQFDPLAFGFERFDARGAVRDLDEHGNALRTDGWIPWVLTGEDRVDYTTYDDYVEALAIEPVVRRCLVRRHVEYFTGRRLERAQLPAVERIQNRMGRATLEELVVAIVTDDAFRTRRIP